MIQEIEQTWKVYHSVGKYVQLQRAFLDEDVRVLVDWIVCAGVHGWVENHGHVRFELPLAHFLKYRLRVASVDCLFNVLSWN